MPKTSSDEKAEKKSHTVSALYRNRFKPLRKGQKFRQNNDMARAIEHHLQYLNTLAIYFDMEEQNLSPNLFDKEKDGWELLLVSQIYWDLAKYYDRGENFYKDFIHSLDQFVIFTVGFKHQNLNAKTLRAFMRQRVARHPKDFQEAYKKIHQETKACLIASDLYGEQGFKTQKLRAFKKNLLNSRWGFYCCEVYYQNVCPLYFFLSSKFGNFFRLPFKKMLDFFVYFLPSRKD